MGGQKIAEAKALVTVAAQVAGPAGALTAAAVMAEDLRRGQPQTQPRQMGRER